MDLRMLDRRYRLTPEMEQSIWKMRTSEKMPQAAIAAKIGNGITQSTICKCLQKMLREHNLVEKEKGL